MAFKGRVLFLAMQPDAVGAQLGCAEPALEAAGPLRGDISTDAARAARGPQACVSSNSGLAGAGSWTGAAEAAGRRYFSRYMRSSATCIRRAMSRPSSG